MDNFISIAVKMRGAGMSTERIIEEYRWICTNKSLCELIDNAIENLMFEASQLSHYRDTDQINGIQCIQLDHKFQYTLRILKNQRKTLWRRVKRKIKEEIEQEDVALPLVNIGVVTRNEPVRVD